MFGLRVANPFILLTGLWSQCSLAKDQALWAEQEQPQPETAFVTVIRSTKLIKMPFYRITTKQPSHKTTPDHGGGAPGNSFTTFPLFSTETYEVQECQFDNDDPGFSKCQTATTVVTYVQGISTSWYAATPTVITDDWPTPWEPTTRTHDYPYPPASSGAPPWETSLDLCDVFSATWCQSTTRPGAGSVSASDSYTHTHSYTLPPPPSTSKITITTATEGGTGEPTILPIPLSSVCVSHNLTTTCFVPHATAGSSTAVHNSTALPWASATAGAGNGTASIHVNVTSLVPPGTAPLPGTVAPTPRPLLYTNSSTWSWPGLSSRTATFGPGTLSVTTLSIANETSSTEASAPRPSHPRHSSSAHMSPATWLPSLLAPAPTTRVLGGGGGNEGAGGGQSNGHAEDARVAIAA
ncbi:hypothetical protein Micbo1qcDRAFT_206387 [Microdochium bolleyi]|uniref:Uncharacterized protein n=1 Tax=Microdochium bolleyi TaxID=196109 RepID=A0A136IXI2_9PEZI|nr:hypothetical protein Micbo1qcDRAFT_206387 [Microdochium bolleyi]